MVASINAVAVQPNSPVSANMQPETACCLRAIVNAIAKVSFTKVWPVVQPPSYALAVNARDQGRSIG